MIALDISKSMMAEDIIDEYNRLDIAKLSIGKLMNELRGDHVGIVVFAGEAYKQLPLNTRLSSCQAVFEKHWD